MQLLLFPQHSPHAREGTLSPGEQLDVLNALLRGGSPQTVCQKLGRDPLDFCRTVADDGSFRAALRQARELMTLNVVATVYRAAMEGTPAAQALWLRTFPPDDWAEPVSSTSATDSDAADDAVSLTNDALKQLLVAFHKEYAVWLGSDAESA